MVSTVKLIRNASTWQEWREIGEQTKVTAKTSRVGRELAEWRLSPCLQPGNNLCRYKRQKSNLQRNDLRLNYCCKLTLRKKKELAFIKVSESPNSNNKLSLISLHEIRIHSLIPHIPAMTVNSTRSLEYVVLLHLTCSVHEIPPLPSLSSMAYIFPSHHPINHKSLEG